MTRKLLIALALGAVALAAGLATMFTRDGGVRSVGELEYVHYSDAGKWREFYVNRAPEGTGWVHLPTPHDGTFYKSDIDPATKGFVRPEVCGECHQDKYRGHRETAHFRTSQAASLETVLGEFGQEKGLLNTRDPHLHFEMFAENGNLYQRTVVQKDGRTYRHAAPFDLVVGSGNHGQSYLYWHGDELYQLPISYFSESGGWINSPGFYRDGTADFARSIGHRCLDCHATFFAAAPGAEVRYDREVYLLGVSCVRCHGSGRDHVEYHRAHPDDTAARHIIHPGRLSRDESNQVCAQCHSGVGELLAPAFTYQPGAPLEQYVLLDFAANNPANRDPHAANQLSRLMKSRCYQESDNLTCATCHDPHRQERGELKLFSGRCAKCHSSDDCQLTATFHGRIEDHCVECHMPSRRDAEGAMQTREGEKLPLLRDHHIAVWPEVSQQVLKRLSD